MAKEEIYTIPVIDAFKEDCECPLCFLYEQLEKDSVDFVLSPSYMEVDVRGMTNELGFCQKHFRQLYAQPNRLGVALMLESHMKKVREDLQREIKKSPKVKGAFFGKKNDTNKGLSSYTSQLVDHCYICSRIDNTFKRYLETFFYLWKKDEDFRKQLESTKGLCLHHFAMLYDQGRVSLNEKHFDDFASTLTTLQTENFDRVIEDLEWFITKFDYRYHDSPWKNAKDAIIRSIRKIASIKVE